MYLRLQVLGYSFWHIMATPPLLDWRRGGEERWINCHPNRWLMWGIRAVATWLTLLSCRVITWTPSWAADKTRFLPFVFHAWIFWDHSLRLWRTSEAGSIGPGCDASPMRTPRRPLLVALVPWHCFESEVFLIVKVRGSLVGGFNPFEKYARQIGSSPQGSGWNENYLKPPTSSSLFLSLGFHFLDLWLIE